MQAYRNENIPQSNYFLRLWSLLLISGLSFLCSQTLTSTGQSGGCRLQGVF